MSDVRNKADIALTVGELVEHLRRYPPDMKVRMMDNHGDLNGIHKIEVLAGRVVLRRMITFIARPRRRY